MKKRFSNGVFDVTQIRMQVVKLVEFYSRNIYEALIKRSPLLRNLQLKTMVEVQYKQAL